MAGFRALSVSALALASLTPGVLAIPTPQLDNLPPQTGPGGDDETGSGPPLRGGSDLLGFTSGQEISPDNPTAVVPSDTYELAAGQGAAPNLGVPFNFDDVENPQPIRGDQGATDPGPRNLVYDRINPNTIAPPGTDRGILPQGKWPMGLSHNRILPGNAGWARQQNTDQLPSATEMAGVDMYLAPNAYRELHWHSANEWSYIFNGSIRVQTLNQDGETFVDDLQAGDVWYFPSGVPHSLQALDEGCEFLLIFDQGDFSDGDTNLATEMILRTPIEVLSKNMNAPVAAFSDTPREQLYIFNGQPAGPIENQNVTGPGGVASGNSSYTYHFSQQEPFETQGGSIKIIDPRSFPIAANFSAALVTIRPGAMREIHWHGTSDEWGFFVAGQGRAGVYVAPESGVTYDFSAGDVSYIPAEASHYIENTGDTDIIFLEVLQAPFFSDISVNQWLRLTPRQIVQDTLHLPDSLLDNLSPNKQYVVQGSTNYTALAGGNGTA